VSRVGGSCLAPHLDEPHGKHVRVTTDDEGATMSGQTKTAAYDGIIQGDQKLSATVVNSSEASALTELVEVRLSTNGTTNSMRLTKTEADVFSLLLARLADDADDLDDASEEPGFAQLSAEEDRSITRDELISVLLNLPRRSALNLHIGNEHVAITGVLPYGR
jgi:hypothetical protein